MKLNNKEIENFYDYAINNIKLNKIKNLINGYLIKENVNIKDFNLILHIFNYSLKIDNNILFNLDVFCYFNNLDNVVVRLNIIKENNNFNTKEIISNKYYICKSMIFIDFVINLGKEYILNE